MLWHLCVDRGGVYPLSTAQMQVKTSLTLLRSCGFAPDASQGIWNNNQPWQELKTEFSYIILLIYVPIRARGIGSVRIWSVKPGPHLSLSGLIPSSSPSWLSSLPSSLNWLKCRDDVYNIPTVWVTFCIAVTKHLSNKQLRVERTLSWGDSAHYDWEGKEAGVWDGQPYCVHSEEAQRGDYWCLSGLLPLPTLLQSGLSAHGIVTATSRLRLPSMGHFHGFLPLCLWSNINSS